MLEHVLDITEIKVVIHIVIYKKYNVEVNCFVLQLDIRLVGTVESVFRYNGMRWTYKVGIITFKLERCKKSGNVSNCENTCDQRVVDYILRMVEIA